MTITWSSTDPARSSGVPAQRVPTVVSGEGAGQTAVSGQSCDPSNNCATGSYGPVNVDWTAPSVSAAVANGAGRYQGPVTVRFLCSDGLSGVASCPADAVLSTDGAALSVSGSAVDVAGNAASSTVSGIRIDSVKPSIVFAGNQGTYSPVDRVAISLCGDGCVVGCASSNCLRFLGWRRVSAPVCAR